MTFRSFSRFVRWYRPELVAGACVAAGLCLATVYRDRWVAGALVAGFGALRLLTSFVFDGLGSDRSAHIWKRHSRLIRWRKDQARSLPLRGWTK